jgi:hypothetical protein
MMIKDLKSDVRNGKGKVAATVTWEDCDRPSYELYFETESEFAESLSCNPHAFLVGTIVPAMHYGERRVAIDAEICPELRQGLITAMSWLRHWYYPPTHELVRIEAKTQSRPVALASRRAGFFFSGGVDSFATLRKNRLTFPPEHPGYIKDGLLVYGLELDDLNAFGYVKDELSKVAKETGITLIPIYSNVYLNYRQEDAHQHFSFWIHEFAGAALSAVAHALAKRLSVVLIPSSDVFLHRKRFVLPYGTHALLDPNYSSYDLKIRQVGAELSRLKKMELIADWDPALQNLRVCNMFKRYQPRRLNCGRCEKCVRTMLTLLTLGVLDRTDAFQVTDISAELLMRALKTIPDPVIKEHYDLLLVALREEKRSDLADAIDMMITSYNRKAWRRKLTAFDQKHFGGQLRRFKRTITPRPNRQN